MKRCNNGYTAFLQLTLDFSHIGEVTELVSDLVPPRVERQNVLLEHALKQANDNALVLQNEPILFGIAANHLEAELLVEFP